MDGDVIHLLQGVKQAEEAKAKAVAEARQKAAARVAKAEAFAAGTNDAVTKRLGAEEPGLKKTTEEKGEEEMAKLERKYEKIREALRSAAQQKMDKTVESLCQRFLDEWKPE